VERTLHNKSGPGVLGFCVSTPAGGLPTTATAAAAADDITQRAPGFYFFFSFRSPLSFTPSLSWGGFKPLCPHSLHAHTREKLHSHTHAHTYPSHEIPTPLTGCFATDVEQPPRVHADYKSVHPVCSSPQDSDPRRRASFIPLTTHP